MAIADSTDKTLADIVSLKGRNAVVTGGAKGLGKAIARRFAEAGANVVLGDLDAATAQDAAAELSDRYGTRVLATALDVREGTSVSALADFARAELGSIDVWVNSAGIFPLTRILEMTDEIWDNVLNINLRGTFIGCREAARKMVDNGGGVIINIASTAGFKGAGPGIPHYVASKHGVRGVTRQFALELAEKDIRVLGIAPTTILTEGVRDVMPSAAETGFDLDQTYHSMLGRTGVPDDVARVALFCASDMSAFMTGSTILVDAGDMTR